MGVLDRLGEGITGQAEGQPVGFRDGVLERVEAANRRDRPERLIVEDRGVQRHVGQDGGREEVARRSDALPARGDLGAALPRLGDDLGHRDDAPLVRQRAERRAFGQAVAKLQPLRMLDHRGGELVLQAVVDQEARGRDADLSRVAELRAAGGLDRQRDIGVLRHDHRRMTAQFHRHPLHVGAGQRRQLLAHRCRSGEGDLADDRVGNEVAGDLGRIAEDQPDGAGRHAGVDEGLEQRRRGCRRLLGRLHEEGASGGQGRAELAHDLVDREVPRREGGHRPDRFLQHQLLRRQVARRHDASIDAAAFVGEPLDDVGAGQHLDLGLGHRLALLLGQQPGDVGRAFAQQCGGAAHGGGALVRRHLAPGLEALAGGFQRAVQVDLAGMGHLADDGTGGRVAHVDGLAADRIDPFVGDQQADIGIGRRRHGGSSWHRPRSRGGRDGGGRG